MAADLIELCEGVLSHIQASSYSYRFTASRRHIAFVRLEDTNGTQVFVYPGTIARAVESRVDYRVTAQVFVHVANYIDTATDQEIDNSIRLTQQLERSLDNLKIGEWSMMAFDSDVSGRPAFQVEGISQRNYFHTAIGLTFATVD